MHNDPLSYSTVPVSSDQYRLSIFRYQVTLVIMYDSETTTCNLIDITCIHNNCALSLLGVNDSIMFFNCSLNRYLFTIVIMNHIVKPPCTCTLSIYILCLISASLLGDH